MAFQFRATSICRGKKIVYYFILSRRARDVTATKKRDMSAKRKSSAGESGYSLLSQFENGFLKCASCGGRVALSDVTPLELSPCPACGCPNFTPTLVGEYWLFKPLGGGGMGSVYMAVARQNQRFYAVKILPRKRKRDQFLIKALMDEAEIGVAIGQHPNVVAIVDYGLADDEYFMVSEFAQGERLDNLLEERGSLDEEDALACLGQLLEAEAHIVSRGFLFRDLKPQNVIIGADGNAKLFDYGLCQPLDVVRSGACNQDSLEGSPYFIPPERVAGLGEGEYSEIYSLGMLVFYMLTGNYYYKKSEISKLVAKHLVSMRVASVEARLKHCSPETVALLDKMIARNPNARYHAFADMEKDLAKAEFAARHRVATQAAPPPPLPNAGKRQWSSSSSARPKSNLMFYTVVGLIAASVIVGLALKFFFFSNSVTALRWKGKILNVFIQFVDKL